MPDELVSRGLVQRVDERWRTTRRFQAAMARAAFRLLNEHGDGDDLRLPIAVALAELAPDVSDDTLTEWVLALLPIEQDELAPGVAVQRP